MTFTPKEITAMAKEAGFEMSRLPSIRAANVYGEVNDELAIFAALVAAKEREACAQVCDELAELNRASPTDSMWQWGECAAAIRARGQKEGA